MPEPENEFAKGLVSLITPKTNVGHIIAEILLLGFGAIVLSIMTRWLPASLMASNDAKTLVAAAPFLVAGLIGFPLVFRLWDAIMDEQRNAAAAANDKSSKPPAK